MSMKIPVTPSGIETTTFGLIARCLNKLHNHVPLLTLMHFLFYTV